MSDVFTHPLPPLPAGFDRANVEAWRQLAWKLIEAKHHAEAIACFQAITQLAPETVEAWANLGSLLAFDGKPHQAVTCYRRAVGLEPGNLALRKALIRALRKAGQRAAALSECNAGIENGANDTEIYSQRGN